MAEKDQYQETKSMMLASLDVLMGGRAAEELYYGSERVTTGAANDLKMATQLATAMVKQCGFSEKVNTIES
jgi:ATP-dependent metalloprotease